MTSLLELTLINARHVFQLGLFRCSSSPSKKLDDMDEAVTTAGQNKTKMWSHKDPLARLHLCRNLLSALVQYARSLRQFYDSSHYSLDCGDA